VAGVRYQDIEVSNLGMGWRVTLNRDWYRGEPCYKVLTKENTMLGYIPYALVPLLEKRRVLSAKLLRINPYAVPWKQLEIGILVE
jgi:hypothetical protein